IDGSWERDVTLVANWGEHYCHLELRWDLAEGQRFYFVGEPFMMNFYLLGQNIQVAPKLYLIHGAEEEEETYVYWNFMFLSVEGFDTLTAGTKHVTVTLAHMPDSYGGEFNASISYDVEVKEPDAQRYGYENMYVNGEEYSAGDVVPVQFPDGYTLSATAKNENWVWTRNWIGTSESDNHAENCSERNYQPWDILRGTTASTDTLEVPAVAGFGEVERYRLLTIYDDMTRVYTPVITVQIVAPEDYGDYAFLGEYVIEKGETFDLAEKGIGSGTIVFHENGTEFTFDNVNFVNDKFKSDGLRSNLGFMYYHAEPKNVAIHLVGENYFTNAYEYQNATGFTVNVQGRRDDFESELLIDGTGSLHITGGSTGIYAPCNLTVDTVLTFASYLDRSMTVISAYAIHLTDNARIYATNVGSGISASAAGMQIDDGAVVDLRLSAPKPIVAISDYVQVQGLYASNDMIISSKHVNISVTVDSDSYEEFQGVSGCSMVVSAQGNIWIDGANMELNLYTRSSHANSSAVFDQANGIYAAKTLTVTGQSSLKMNLQADLFNFVTAMGAGSDITVDENSEVNVYERCITGLDGISTEGKLAFGDGARVNITGFRVMLDEDAFGIFAGEFEIGAAELSVTLNNGFALATYLGLRDEASGYEQEYVPEKTSGLGDDVAVGAFSMMAAPGTFHTFETIYDLSDPEHPVVATRFAVDYCE
ncbi:MAG: hypothetical protein J6W87_01595, partial [Clostridia bacterium]|nr:hypothetical protein [Clostridia bacterium]